MRTYIESILKQEYSPSEAKELALVIIEECLGISRSQALLNPIPVTAIPTIDNLLHRLLQHEPIEYIFGHTEWMGLHLKVSPHTLIPRPETAELVEHIIKVHYLPHQSLRVLDIGTGSGCIAIALKKRCPEWEVYGLDISKEALQIAQENAIQNHTHITFIERDILHPDSLQSVAPFDIVVSNPPYIPYSQKQSMESNVLDYEPASALFVPDEDPLLFYTQIARRKKARFLYFEINEFFGEQMRLMMRNMGYHNVTILQDSFGKDRIAYGELPNHPSLCNPS